MKPEKYFYNGTMGTGKSARALAEIDQYTRLGMNVFLIKSAFDDRNGVENVTSRNGFAVKANAIINSNSSIIPLIINCGKKPDLVIVDECQFLTKKQVDELATIVHFYGISVHCYGLRNNMKGELFKGTQYLFERYFEDVTLKIPCCKCCQDYAMVDVYFKDGKPYLPTDGEVCIGDIEKDGTGYKSLCYACWQKVKEV